MTLDSPTSLSDVRNDALRMLSNGLYVLTTCAGETLHAATVSWVSQVSFRPLLVMVALRRNSHLADAVRTARRFAINILAADQEMTAEKFFEHTQVRADQETLAGHSFRPSPARCPLLTDAPAWLECRFASEPATPGDHCLIVGEVTGAGVRRREAPLVLWNTRWTYGGVGAP